MSGNHCLQAGSQVTIDLHQVQFRSGVQQARGQCGSPRADFHDALTHLWVDGLDYLPDNVRIGQEILSETLAGPVLRGRIVHASPSPVCRPPGQPGGQC